MFATRMLYSFGAVVGVGAVVVKAVCIANIIEIVAGVPRAVFIVVFASVAAF